MHASSKVSSKSVHMIIRCWTLPYVPRPYVDTLIHELVRFALYKQGVEHLVCDIIMRHFIKIVAAAILQLLSTSMIQFSSALRLF